mmetsp:Transcript_4605/g.10069  ORF Transcript_4605/g.10069 Transcript_4605/m.10069 type:complete len:89 (+) Transcript_4605:22-288(+)
MLTRSTSAYQLGRLLAGGGGDGDGTGVLRRLMLGLGVTYQYGLRVVVAGARVGDGLGARVGAVGVREPPRHPLQPPHRDAKRVQSLTV